MDSKVKNILRLALAAALLSFGPFVWGQANIYNHFSPSNGVLKGSATSYFTTSATAADIEGLWSGTCNASTFLRGDGACAAVSGTGTVTSVGLTTPSWLTVTGSPVTTSGTLAISATGSLTANQFLSTPDSAAGAISLRSIVGNDLPPINLGSTANGGVSSILLGTNGGTSNGFFSVTGPATSLKTFTFPNASATVLTSNAAVTVAQGGTGLGTLTAHGVLLGEGTSNVGSVAAMAADTLLQGQGATSDPATIALPSCSLTTNALSYSTSTHTFGCNTIAGGGGGTPGGSSGQIQYNNAGAFGGISVTAGQVLQGGGTPTGTATPTLGASGTLGSLTMGNATSGTVTLQPVSGALGSVTASLPANTGTLAETNLAQTWSATQTFGTLAATTAISLSNALGADISDTNGTTTIRMGIGSYGLTGSAVFGVDGPNTLILATNSLSRAQLTSGLIVGSPTGGDKGAGSINVQSCFINNVACSTSTGTVTGVTAGTGLTGGTISTSGTIALSTPVSVANGGTGTASPSLVAGTGIGVTGTWPGQTVSLSTPVSVANGGTGTSSPSLVAGGGISVTGSWPNQTVTATGGVSALKFAAGLMTTSGGTTCTVNTNLSNITSCSESGAGRPVVNFTTSYFTSNFGCTATAVSSNLSQVVNTNGINLNSLQIYITQSGSNIDGTFELVCFGT